jgi:hypothetical protein
MNMLDGSNSSELWLVRTWFADDAAWNALAADAEQTRACLPEASLVVYTDRTQCHKRIRRIMTRLATRAEANSQFFVAIADRQTFGHPDRLLLTVDCSPEVHTAGQLSIRRLVPQHAFLLGTADRQPNSGHSVDPVPLTQGRVSSTVLHPRSPTSGTANVAALVSDAIHSSQLWKRTMTRETPRG